MPGERILAVDDNPLNLELLRVMLKARGYDVRLAQNADEALTSLTEAPPRLILMDLQLPGRDGLSLTRQLRQDPAFADVVIVAVTSYAMKGDRERALEAGCDDYVTKPIDTRALPTLIAQHLAQGRLAKQA
jgi:CheY-like chemotaxis protein